MKALVVYDSVFGNTAKVAESIGGALREGAEVDVVKVDAFDPSMLGGVDVLIVGSPTRAFQPTPAAKKALGSIPAGGLSGVKVAAFDTRTAEGTKVPKVLMGLIKVFGWAAKPLADRMTKKGGQLSLPLAGFRVLESEGPLKEGELERAKAWAKGILAQE